ncbi:alkene reductase [Chryseobacterium sp. RG1]|uniref:Alkene reductase n=1 Tax=Chryseobacterium tagetis TaxID=2801334 RepID=A0ABS8A2I1_9FLAO|nr:alkene reductase [Chryseobacterium tagetis]MCA6067975.1 alkene reductase [Chryseobacterium tagetis]
MKLLQGYDSGELKLKNRVVMAPMTRCRADNEGNVATALIAEYYAQRASAGLLISEGTYVNDTASGYINVPCIYTEEQIEGWKKVTKAVHEKGGTIFAQLWHVGRLTHPDFLNGKEAIAPSAINGHFTAYTKEGFKETKVPREMTIEDINEVINDFKKAAANAIEAGFDGIELHAANGYLFHQFFSKCSNIRTDNYGGSIENRIRFLFEVLDAMSDAIGQEKIAVRIAPSLDQTFGIVLDDESEALYDILVDRLNRYKLAYLHISGFTMASSSDPLNLVLSTAKHFRAIYKGTLMINKGFNAQTANTAIENDIADLVSFGELYIGNPDLVERFANNSPLNTNNRETYYTGGANGYTDYEFLLQ